MQQQWQKYPAKQNHQILPKIGNKQMPNSEEAELRVIGAVLMSPICLNQVLDIINVDHFYSEKHKLIFQSILNLSDQNLPIEMFALRKQIRKDEVLEQTGGDSYLLKINKETPTSANVQYFCLVVLENAIKRNVIEVSYKMYHSAISETENIIDVIPRSIEELQKNIILNTRDNPDNDATQYSNYLSAIKDGKIKALATGLRDLDNLIDGFFPGEFIIIAGRPGAGKSALAVTISLYQCFYLKNPVHFVSIEMSRDQLMNRIISQQTGIPIQSLKNGRFTEEEHGKIIGRLHKHATDHFYIDSNISDIDMICQSIRIRCIKNKTKLVFIDNFQNIRTTRNFFTEKIENSFYANTFRDLAKELNINIISLNQLNRNANTRGRKQPILSDLRDTGDLEQDAHQVILIDRPDADPGRTTFDDDTDSKGLADIIIAKNRDGNNGVVRVQYKGEIARFQTYNRIEDRETW